MQRRTQAATNSTWKYCRVLFASVVLVTCVFVYVVNTSRLAVLLKDTEIQTDGLLHAQSNAGRDADTASVTTTRLDVDSGGSVIPSTQTIKTAAVCTVASNPRQGSIFRTNLMATLGSGKYTYAITPAGKCTWTAPRVRLIPFVKCCTKLAVFLRTVAAAVSQYDVLIITGDEYCAIQDHRAHFRQYYSPDVVALSHPMVVPGLTRGGEPVSFPRYMPLGPRAEFERVQSFELRPPAQRKFLFNFLGAMTSASRKHLKKVVSQDSFKAMDFKFAWHSVDTWTADIKKGGYMKPQEYRRILLSSQFTLCPAGHNPESFRIFEACEAGSIPVLTSDNWTSNKDEISAKTQATTTQRCHDPYRVLLDSGAPFVMLDDWNELPLMLEHARRNASYVFEKHLQVQEWYARYMRTIAHDFEAVLEYRFRERMRRGRG